MVLKETIKKMHGMLSSMKKDLEKAEKGNRAASQRVRTGSVKFSKVSKIFRKESVAAEKKGGKKMAKKKVAKKKPCARKPCKGKTKKTSKKSKRKKK
ncbi:MAG: hypothetical protein AMS24_00480 [Chlamydiae bacterium SM23_39]|nr:MAG: hypothetical protein AMS24_00480 [Chlamydiae bacterium SM23_39]